MGMIAGIRLIETPAVVVERGQALLFSVPYVLPALVRHCTTQCPVLTMHAVQTFSYPGNQLRQSMNCMYDALQGINPSGLPYKDTVAVLDELQYSAPITAYALLFSSNGMELI